MSKVDDYMAQYDIATAQPDQPNALEAQAIMHELYGAMTAAERREIDKRCPWPVIPPKVRQGDYTLKDLLEALQELSPSQLSMTATVLDVSTNEAFPINECFIFSELPARHADELDFEDDQPLFVVGGPVN